MGSTFPIITRYEKSNQADDKIIHVMDEIHPAKPKKTPEKP